MFGFGRRGYREFGGTQCVHAVSRARSKDELDGGETYERGRD